MATNLHQSPDAQDVVSFGATEEDEEDDDISGSAGEDKWSNSLLDYTMPCSSRPWSSPGDQLISAYCSGHPIQSQPKASWTNASSSQTMAGGTSCEGPLPFFPRCTTNYPSCGRRHKRLECRVLGPSICRPQMVLTKWDSVHCCCSTEAVIRLVLSALVVVATVIILVYDIRSRRAEQDQAHTQTSDQAHTQTSESIEI